VGLSKLDTNGWHEMANAAKGDDDIALPARRGLRSRTSRKQE
jgi:hypothetical protein